MSKEAALARVIVPLAPPAIALVAVIVQTVFDVCATEIELMLVKLKSVPFEVLMVEQSMVPVVAVIVKVLVFVVPVAEVAAKTNTGVVASMTRLAVAFKLVVARESPVVWLPNSTV